MADYKSILISNNTTDSQVTLYIYSKYDPICWLSFSSKILKPDASFLYRSEEGFKFQIKTGIKKAMKTVVDVRKWTKDTFIAIYNTEVVNESDLSDHEFEKTICVRNLNLQKEASLDEGRNLYEVLKLNFKDVRKLEKGEQDKVIFKAYKREIRLWHSDISGEFGDTTMAHEVIAAYKVLRNREKRARYHNMADYSSGWLSKARWRSVLFTECETKEQKKRYRRRLIMMAVSVVLGISGLALSVFTAGTSIPASVVVFGAIFGSGLLGGSVQSLLRLTNRNSIENGCDVFDYLQSFTIGFTAGALTGGVGVKITAAIAGIGEAAAHAASLTFGEYILMGASSAAAGGTFFSLAADAERVLVDGEDLTWKQVAGHALAGAIIGCTTGIAVGAVSGACVASIPTELSSPTGEKMVPGMRRIAASVLTTFSKIAVEKGSDAVLGLIANFIEERFDDELENRTGWAHLKDAAIKTISNFALDVVSKFASITVEHIKNEVAVNKQIDMEGTPDRDVLTSEQERRQHIRSDLDEISKRHYLKWTDCTAKTSYNPNTQPKQQSIVDVQFDNFEVQFDNFEKDEVSSGRFRYISDGLWKSKMIVAYIYEGKMVEKMAKSGYAVEIPIEAEKIQVFFQVMRFINTWCDVKKWNRFEKKWYEDRHTFIYERPPEQRCFTLDGSLYYERVINITNEMHDDVEDM